MIPWINLKSQLQILKNTRPEKQFFVTIIQFLPVVERVANDPEDHGHSSQAPYGLHIFEAQATSPRGRICLTLYFYTAPPALIPLKHYALQVVEPARKNRQAIRRTGEIEGQQGDVHHLLGWSLSEAAHDWGGSLDLTQVDNHDDML